MQKLNRHISAIRRRNIERSAEHRVTLAAATGEELGGPLGRPTEPTKELYQYTLSANVGYGSCTWSCILPKDFGDGQTLLDYLINKVDTERITLVYPAMGNWGSQGGNGVFLSVSLQPDAGGFVLHGAGPFSGNIHENVAHEQAVSGADLIGKMKLL